MAQVQISGLPEGWTCAKCGMWVQNGTMHICNQSQPWYPCIVCDFYKKIDLLIEKLTKLIEVMEAKK